MSTDTIQNKIKDLESQLVGDMFKDMELKEEIFNLKQQLQATSTEQDSLPEKPDDSQFECVGCGS